MILIPLYFYLIYYLHFTIRMIIFAPFHTNLIKKSRKIPEQDYPYAFRLLLCFPYSQHGQLALHQRRAYNLLKERPSSNSWTAQSRRARCYSSIATLNGADHAR